MPTNATRKRPLCEMTQPATLAPRLSLTALCACLALSGCATIAVDMPALAALGTQSDDSAGGLATGDNSAYSVLMSRYMQAIQHERGLELDSAVAGLRTACLTGVATTKMSREVTTPDGNTIMLTAGDVDEAVSGILTNGLVASDVNGESVPSGFSRIDAFRLGVLGDADRCVKRFP